MTRELLHTCLHMLGQIGVSKRVTDRCSDGVAKRVLQAVRTVLACLHGWTLHHASWTASTRRLVVRFRTAFWVTISHALLVSKHGVIALLLLYLILFLLHLLVLEDLLFEKHLLTYSHLLLRDESLLIMLVVDLLVEELRIVVPCLRCVFTILSHDLVQSGLVL